MLQLPRGSFQPEHFQPVQLFFKSRIMFWRRLPIRKQQLLTCSDFVLFSEMGLELFVLRQLYGWVFAWENDWCSQPWAWGYYVVFCDTGVRTDSTFIILSLQRRIWAADVSLLLSVRKNHTLLPLLPALMFLSQILEYYRDSAVFSLFRKTIISPTPSSWR